jgi:cytochrome c peroxidase
MGMRSMWVWVFLVACGESAPTETKPEAKPEPAKPAPGPQSTLGAVPIPADNPQSEAKIALGHQLFFDKRLSVDSSVSCYSCHQNEDGNAGHDPIAIGATGKKLTRHSPVIWNVGFLGALYWDGRAPSLEAQATGAWSGGNMGVGKEGLAAKAAEIGAIPGYKSQFDAVFPGVGATPDTVVQALSAYERTLVCDDTAWDRFKQGDAAALTDEQKAGEALFLGKAACAACHTPPFFSAAYSSPTGVYYNAGVGTKDVAEDKVDTGRMTVTKADADWAAFKVPTLRNIAKTAPYFHDGSAPDLTAAVKLMAGGGVPNKNLTPILTDKGLSDAEVGQLVAFLGALNCGGTLVEPKLP